MSSGKGGGTSGTSTVTQTNLPEYARPYFERLMQEGEAVSNEPYQAYQGPRLAGFAPDMLGAQQGYRDLNASGTPWLNAGADAAQNAIDQSDPNYDPHSYDYQQVDPSGRVGYDDYNQLYQNFYNPFVRDVIDQQNQQAQLSFQEAGLDRNDAAIKAGAFGGSRQAVGNYLAERGMLDRMNMNNATGLRDAFNMASGSAVDAQKYNINSRMQADLANQGQYLEAQRLSDASNQFGVDAQLRGSALGIQGAGLLGDLENNRYNLTEGSLQNLASIGQDYQQLSQAGLDLQYEDFVNQRDYPRQNLEFLSGLLRGVPTSANSNVTTTQNVSPGSSLIGGGLSAYALSQLMGSGTQTT